MIETSLAYEAFDPHARLAAYDTPGADRGALASFVGYCRGRSHGRDIETLELQHYPGFTEQAIGRIAQDASASYARARRSCSSPLEARTARRRSRRWKN
jgi:molybdopterin synthase catalytic subunit